MSTDIRPDHGNSLPLPLLIWLSPAFPIGAFAYSHGLEWAVEAGDIRDGASLRLWLEDLLAQGGPRNDGVLLAAAWHAVAAGKACDLAAANDLALALAPSAERYLETAAQGNAFVAAIGRSWPSAHLAKLAAIGQDVAYPIAVGAAAAEQGIDLDATLSAFLLAAQSNFISAALRLGIIGQSEALDLIAGLAAAVQSLAVWAAESRLDDLGGCALRSDIASMRHETQYSRLFRA